MKFYKLSIFALALAAGVFTSCSDDDNYVDSPLSPGAYFPVDAPEQINPSEGESSFTVTVMRTETSATATSAVTMTDESGLFTCPAEVTFAQGSNSADLVITFDPEKVVMETEYPITLTVASKTDDGPATYDVVVKVKSPMITEPFGAGTGTYIYSVCPLDIGVDPDLPITKSSKVTNPNDVVFTIEHWCADVPLEISCDMTRKNDDGEYIVHVAPQYIGYTDGTYGRIYISDVYNFEKSVDAEEDILEMIEDASTYDPATGLFTLYVCYIAPDYSATGWFGDGYEYFQMDGFPDYSVEVNYDGIFTTADGSQSYAVGTITTGADVEETIVVNIEGKDVASAVAAIVAGTLEGETINGSTSKELRLPIAGAGEYSMIAVTFAGNEAREVGYKTYKVSGGVAEQGDWESIGMGSFVDGWIYPGFTLGDDPVNPFDFEYEVEIQKDLNNEGVFRMVAPYGIKSGNIVCQQLNENETPRDIVFDMSNPDFVILEYQNSGFTIDDEPWYISDGDWFYINLLDEDVTPEDVIAAGLNSYYDSRSSMIEFTKCLFGFGEDIDDFGYSWKSGYPAELVMPDAPASAKYKAIRKVVGHQGDAHSIVFGNDKVRNEMKLPRALRNGLLYNATQKPTPKGVR